MTLNMSHTNESGRRHAAFTLVELLVVIAIIGVLIAILLPAVQRVREAARRSACSGNGKQIGLAIHNFLSAHGRFPYQGSFWGGAGADVSDPLIKSKATGSVNSWIVVILPYLEETERYDLWMGGAALGNSLNKGPIRPIECPSSGWAASAHGRSTYPVVSNWGSVYGRDQSANTGIFRGGFGKMLPSERDDVTDGLSNTAMLGEIATHDKETKKFLYSTDRSGARRDQCLTATVFEGDGRGHGLAPLNGPNVRVNMSFIPNSRMCGTAWTTNKDLETSHRGTCVASWHPGGAHVIMGDGGVKFVNEDVDCGGTSSEPDNPWAVLWGTDHSKPANDKGVWGAIATRAGGESERLP